MPEHTSSEQMFPNSTPLKIDASGLRCPMPLLKAKQGLNRLKPGQLLQLTATDPGSRRDFKSFTELTQHELVSIEQSASRIVYLIRKGSVPKS